VVEIKTPGEIDAIGAAGQVVARVLAAARAIATPGTRPAELDEAAHDQLIAAALTAAGLTPEVPGLPAGVEAVRRRAAGGAARGGAGSDAAQITSWVEAHFTATTVGGQAVYDLTAPNAGS